MSSNTSLAFGSGILIATPPGLNPTPVQFGTLQDVSIDFTFSIKSLMGQYQFPVAVGRGEGKISGKAKFANIDGAVWSNIFLGNTKTTGQKMWAYNEGGSIPAVSTYTITVANSATWTTDLGVVFASSGLALTNVASAPTTGQYSVAAGVYTFAAADASKAVLITYGYTQAVTGFKSTIGNTLMGVAPTFQIDFYETNPNIAGAQWSLRLFACVSTKLTVASKNSDFTIPEMDFEAFANSANSIGEINTAA